MAPKSTFSIPMGDVIEVVTETKRSKRGVRTVEKEVPFHSSSLATRSASSRPKETVMGNFDRPSMDETSHQLDEVAETHTLQPIEEQEDQILHLDIEDPSLQSNVCFMPQIKVL